jgi:hypothetical protein
MDKSEKITLFATILLAGFTLGVIYHYIIGFYMHAGESSRSFLYPTSDSFCDLFSILHFIKDFAPYKQVVMWVAYFPLTYLCMFPFTLIKNHLLCYLIYISPFLTYLIFQNSKLFSCKNLTNLQNFQNIFILTVISYPVLYILDKGNFDMYLFILFGACVYAFKSKKYLLSSILLAVVNAMKPFTILFLLLFLKQKKYKECLLSIILSGLLVVGGFLIFKGDFFQQVNVFLSVQLYFKKVYALTNYIGIGFCSSLFMPLKVMALNISANPTFISDFVKIYDYFCILITILTMFFIWREKVLWKQLTLIICNFILLPYCTYDYKLIFFFIPIWLFVNEKNKSPFDLAYIIIFSLLFIPKNIMLFFPLMTNGLINWTSFSAIINPIIIIVLSLLIIYEQFFTKNLEEGL